MYTNNIIHATFTYINLYMSINILELMRSTLERLCLNLNLYYSKLALLLSTPRALPLILTHWFHRSGHFLPQPWKSSCLSAFSCTVMAILISRVNSKHFPFMVHLTMGRARIYGAKSGEWHGWGGPEMFAWACVFFGWPWTAVFPVYNFLKITSLEDTHLRGL